MVGARPVAVAAGGVAGEAGGLGRGELLGAAGGGAGAQVPQQVVAGLAPRAEPALAVQTSDTRLVTCGR